MKLIKKFDYIYKFLIFILLFTLILSVINLVFDLSDKINSFISLIGVLICIFLDGIKRGRNALEKAYRVGIIIGLIYVLLLIVLSLITLSFNFSLKRFIYYTIIIVTMILGCIIGINKKSSK